MTTFKRIVLGFVSACVLLCGCVMFAGNAEAWTVPPVPQLGTQHNSFPHQKRLRLTPVFHSQKVKNKGKYIGYKMVRKWSVKAQKYVVVRVPVIHETKLKLGKVPKVTGIKVHHAKVYRVGKVKGFKLPVFHGKVWHGHSVVYHYKR